MTTLDLDNLPTDCGPFHDCFKALHGLVAKAERGQVPHSPELEAATQALTKLAEWQEEQKHLKPFLDKAVELYDDDDHTIVGPVADNQEHGAWVMGWFYVSYREAGIKIMVPVADAGDMALHRALENLPAGPIWKPDFEISWHVADAKWHWRDLNSTDGKGGFATEREALLDACRHFEITEVEEDPDDC